MRAARYVGNGGIEVGASESDVPGAGQVQIAVEFTGICGTDLHILHGAMDGRVTLPAILGHEMSGRVAAIGPGVENWAIGDPVTVMPLRWCGVCPTCLAGHTHICQNLDFMGIDSPGSMQPLWTVPADVLVRLPEGLSLRDAALVEPTAVAVHDVRRAAVMTGERAVVVGGGPVGLLIACVARAAGADVLVFEVDGFRRSVIEDAGLKAVDPSGISASDLIVEWSRGSGASVSFEVSGTQPGLTTALDVLAPRGRLVVVGIHAQPREVNMHGIFWRELTILGARVYERTDFEAAADLVGGGVIPTAALISRVEPLHSAAKAFEALELGGNTMKVLIDCRQA